MNRWMRVMRALALAGFAGVTAAAIASETRLVTVVDGLNRPWGMTWLPDGRMLVTEKRGALVAISGTTKAAIPLEGLPEVYDGGQGGLMDIALHPDFARNNFVYFTVSTGTDRANRTTLVRGVFRNNRVTGIRTLWRVSQDKSGGQHFGSRMVWLPDKTLLVSIGDGGNPPASLNGEFIRNNAQKLNSAIGKIVRLTDEGRPAPGNTFARQQGALPEVWSIGHRNIQGLARDPRNGRIYANEHGARGGDELNLVENGKNYGWPLATHSREYSGREISPNKTLPGMANPILLWTPSKAPSGLAVYTGDRFPAWRGHLFSGGLVTGAVHRVALDSTGTRVTGQELIRVGQRVRDIRQGPDGFLYVLTDERDGRLIRIVPDR